MLARGRLRLELRAWAKLEAALARFESPDRLIGFLWDKREPSEEKDRVLLALLRLARRESSASRIVLQAMLPGLKTLAAAMLKRHPEHGDPALDREELWQVLFVEMLERIKTYPLERRPGSVAANLVLDVKHAVLAEAQRARAAAGRVGLSYNLARIRVQRARKRLLMSLRPWTQDLYVQVEPKRASYGPSSGAYAPEAITDTQEQAG